jgi:hypothetical protein
VPVEAALGVLPATGTTVWCHKEEELRGMKKAG